ncbi:universal stress protein [Amycolatopsis sp. TNS106]|uniref:universal stress protein n=1 Tax=Amycolatopsis sp. TNS106 TaxID=2861750 RepID=UPI001C57E7D1|nr:universal stress protein [Amycolatopsis sp. TNS106]QXV56504.1 universal stress protein [Amycolatopsis sp. TNS106]
MDSEFPVLAGVDGSRPGLAAVGWAAKEAARRRVPLELLWVYAPVSDRDPAGGYGTRCLRDASAVATAAAPEVPKRCVAEPGDVVETLIQRSASSSLVALGAAGRDRPYLGHVTRMVAARAVSPVVVVRAAGPAPGAVVVGVDDSLAGETALSFAAETAALRQCPLVPVRVWYDRNAESDAEKLLAACTEATASARPDVQILPRLVRQRDEAGGLLGESADAGLLVVGSHGRRLRTRPILGVTSHEVLERARCPVAVVSAACAGPAARDDQSS